MIKGERGRIFHVLAHSLVVPVARAGGGQIQEPRTLSWSLTCVTSVQTLEPSCTTFPRLLKRSWIKSETSGT